MDSPNVTKTSADPLFAFFVRLWQRRVLLIRNIFLAGVISVAIALILPKTYRASAVLMPPSEEMGVGMLGNLMSSPLSAFMGAGSSTEALSIQAILKSRTLAESTIEEFDLMSFWDVENRQDALEGFSESYVLTLEEEGTIRLDFYVNTGWFASSERALQCAKLAADITNYMISELDIINKELKTESARFNRIFIENRYQQNLEDLKQAEDAMLEFQNKNNMVALPEQTSAAITAAATIQAEIMSSEVELETQMSTLQEDHPRILTLKKNIEGLKEKLADLEAGENLSDIFPGFRDIADLAIDYGRLYREIKIQNTLFTFLTQQYEEAKIKEAKDTPTVQVLDAAIIPEKKARPRRSLFVIFWTFFTGVLTTLYIQNEKGLRSFIEDVLKQSD